VSPSTRIVARRNAAYMAERRTRRLLQGLYAAIVCLFVRNM
jgi:hypothetical protein